jgi:hypothetical protein
VCFERDSLLGLVAVMHIWWYQLVRASPLGDGRAVGCFLVEDFVGDKNATGAKTFHSFVEGGDKVVVALVLKGLDKDGVGTVMVSSHDVSVAAHCSDGELSKIVSEKRSEGYIKAVEFIGR